MGKQYSTRIQDSNNDPMILSQPVDRQRQRTKNWLILSSVVSGLLLVPWFAYYSFAAMVGWPYVVIEEGWDLQAVAFSLMLFYPLYFVALSLGARSLHKKQQYKWAAIAGISPLLLEVGLVLLWAASG